MAGKNANTYDEWMKLARQRRTAATVMLENSVTTLIAFENTGLSIECAMKAVIAKRKRFNEWPQPKDAPELFGHNLRLIARYGDLFPPAEKVEICGHFHALLDWKRDKVYAAGRIDRKHVRRLYLSAFGPNGVMEWLNTL